jgi:hypothetical protein
MFPPVKPGRRYGVPLYRDVLFRDSGRMTKSTALDRVAADLRQGHTQPAIARLSSLVHTHRRDLDLRRQLSTVHRAVGNAVEAGRWGYLDPDTPAEDIAAFERAHPDPARRLWLLRWSDQANSAPTAYARDQLVRLGAGTGTGHRLDRAGSAALLLALGIFLALALLGAVTVVQWLLP